MKLLFKYSCLIFGNLITEKLSINAKAVKFAILGVFQWKKYETLVKLHKSDQL
jgi:hypothetical protein